MGAASSPPEGKEDSLPRYGKFKILNQKRGKTSSSRHTFILFRGNWKPFRVQNGAKEQWG